MAGSYGLNGPTGGSSTQLMPWNRTNIPQTAGSTPENPTARPDFYGSGPFNAMAFNQTPFSQPNPYGSFFQTPQYGGRFAPFGSTTGGAFSRGGNSSIYQQPGYGYGYGNPYAAFSSFGMGMYAPQQQPSYPAYGQPFSGYRRTQQRPWMGAPSAPAGNPYGAGWA